MSTSNKLFQAASGGAGESVYVDDVFSPFLYAGDSSAGLRTIDNGLNLLDEGGLIWTKERNNVASLFLIDTERGLSGGYLKSNDSDGANTSRVNESIDSFTTTGYKLDGGGSLWNRDNYNYVSWSFRKQAGFFDVVTYTGDGTSSRDIAHNLGSKPGFIITKRTNLAGNWTCYHQALGYEERIYLDLTNAKSTNSATWVQEPTATHFTVGSENTSGSTYVAYLFAHDDQSFGDNSDESIIKCGSFTTDSNGDFSVNLGFEPQWLLWKRTDGSQPWYMVDVMRGFPVTAAPVYLQAQSSAAEFTGGGYFLTNTGFGASGITSSANYIYIAIRRPMKTPEAGTEVFSPITSTGTGSARTLSGTFPTDLTFMHQREATDDGRTFAWDRLRGKSSMLQLTNTSAEAGITGVGFDVQNGLDLTDSGFSNYNTAPYITYLFKRAAGFFDVVAYTGNGSARTINHNLTVVPEMIIIKCRTVTRPWLVYHSTLGNAATLNITTTDGAVSSSTAWNTTTPTSSVFSVGAQNGVNQNGEGFIAYLFATLAGVSKVGSYTGTGSDLNVDCGFTSGARFIFIKRTDAAGDWYIWDSARGIVAGNDPYFRPNVSGAEVTSTDYIDPLASGFTVTSSASSTVNVSSGEYIFLAIA